MSYPTRLAFLSFVSTFLAIHTVAFLIPIVKAMTGLPSEPVAISGRSASKGDVSEIPPSHLIVLVHGLGGTPEDLSYLKKSLQRKSGNGGVLVHLARSNKGKTKDGVAEGGSRLADEIRQVVKSNPSLTRISLVGNSLGGLYVRYAARLLYRAHDDGVDDDQRPQQKTAGDGDRETGTSGRLLNLKTTASLDNGKHASQEVSCPGGTVAGLQPSVFMTIASPHLGVRKFTYVPVPSTLQTLAGELVGRTGSDLFMKSSTTSDGTASPGTVENDDSDGGSSGRSSLLYDMATTEEYLTPLKAFRCRRAYANRRGDFMVPYGTAAFVGPDEGDDRNPVGADGLSTFDRVWGAREGAIVGLSRVPAASILAVTRGDQVGEGNGRQKSATRFGRRTGSKKVNITSAEEEMAVALNSCGWEKVSVDFGGVIPSAHNKICALSRSPLTTALFSSGNKIMDNAAEVLVAHDFEDGHSD